MKNRQSLSDSIHEAMHFGQCGRLKALFLIAVAGLRQRYSEVYCARFGHDTVAEADVENGSEDVQCVRCGWGFHAQF